MQFSNNGSTAFRISGAVAILMSILPIAGAVWSIRTAGVDSTLPNMLIDILVPLVPGGLALLGRSTVFLPVAYGWLLASLLPKLLLVPHQMELLQKTIGNVHTISGVGLYAYWGMLCAIAATGLALYLLGVYRQNEERKN